MCTVKRMCSSTMSSALPGSMLLGDRQGQLDHFWMEINSLRASRTTVERPSDEPLTARRLNAEAVSLAVRRLPRLVRGQDEHLGHVDMRWRLQREEFQGHPTAPQAVVHDGLLAIWRGSEVAAELRRRREVASAAAGTTRLRVQGGPATRPLRPDRFTSPPTAVVARSSKHENCP